MLNHRFQPFPPLPQPTKIGGKLSLTDRWAYLKEVFLAYRLSTFEQMSKIKAERQMATDHVMILLENFLQLSTCLLKSDEERERISSHHYLSGIQIVDASDVLDWSTRSKSDGRIFTRTSSTFQCERKSSNS